MDTNKKGNEMKLFCTECFEYRTFEMTSKVKGAEKCACIKCGYERYAPHKELAALDIVYQDAEAGSIERNDEE